ncbi:hypothetical protein KR222_006309, partial [Zaprionus bogoriensis]
MNQVWLFFAVMHILADVACLIIHILGSLHRNEPLPHNLLFCGTFASYMLIGIYRAILLVIGHRTLLYQLMLVEVSGMIMHFMCALLVMHYAENDFHLIFMGPQQELDHSFLSNCKRQATACIAAGVLYLVHTVLVLDLLVKTLPNEDQKPIVMVTEPPVWDNTFYEMSIEERDNFTKTDANVYFLGKRIDHWLCVKSRWFRQLAQGQQL